MAGSLLERAEVIRAGSARGLFSSQVLRPRRDVRGGVPPTELVDGEKLVEMLEEFELELHPVEAFGINEEFFEDYR